MHHEWETGARIFHFFLKIQQQVDYYAMYKFE